MKGILITVNILAACYMHFFAIPMTRYTQDVNAASMAKALYGEGVINEVQLERMYPASLEHYGYRNLQSSIDLIAGYPAMMAFILNAILIAIFMGRKPKAEQVSGSNGGQR